MKLVLCSLEENGFGSYLELLKSRECLQLSSRHHLLSYSSSNGLVSCREKMMEEITRGRLDYFT